MARIFISYRRSAEIEMAAGRLRDTLVRYFGERMVFRDRESILPSDDWEQAIDKGLDDDTVVLALIGAGWATETDLDGHRIIELDKWNRLELERALNRGLLTIPVLVGRASMPLSHELPESIRTLSTIHALLLRDADWGSDIRHVITTLEESGVAREARRTGRTPTDPTAIAAYLKRSPLFWLLSENELKSVAAASLPISVPRGTRLFEEGARADYCYVLTAGRAKVLLEERQILLTDVTLGDLVGEVELLSGSPRVASLVTVESSHLVRIPAAAFEALRGNRSFERRLVTHLAQLLGRSTDRVRGTSGSIRERLIWTLAEIARHEGKREGTKIVIRKRPHQELASMTGCSRAAISRLLRTLSIQKYVSWEGHEMHLEFVRLLRYLSDDDAERLG
jgi:CRP-like cAMP-binding protein